MAHFAELNHSNRVLRVVVVNNAVLLDDDGNESEQIGIDFCHSLFGGVWKQTSFNHTFITIYIFYRNKTIVNQTYSYIFPINIKL